MPRITRITEHPRKSGHYIVDVEGKELAVVSVDALGEVGAGVGTDLTDAQCERLRAAGAELATYDRAVNMLAHRARSVRDLRRRLMQKGEPEALVDRAIARLQTLGLIDDSAFARQVARSKLVGQGASKRRVHQELFRRGVARAVADDAVDEVFTEESVDESEVIEALARKRMRSLGGLDPATQRRRLYSFLARRGYDSDAIRRALGRVLGAAGARLDEIGADDDEATAPNDSAQ